MIVKPLCAALGAVVLAGCVNVGIGGGKAPEQLLTLTSTATVATGTMREGRLDNALAVAVPAVPRHLDVARVPVQTGGNSLAYLADAFWVEKPASLFQRVLVETIRAGGSRMVVTGGELEYGARTQLDGELLAMDYDAAMSRVVVRFDAVLRQPDGTIRQRRFESEETGVLPTAAAVAPAMNRAANDVAAQVAQWVG
ncbi:ABC-type transport auxiliary lipoprotein family protein [Alteraurantiacibacter palmitatis]|uniref:ABC-type transport auxiliary lipoprotein family protein n=1 Tax=Alteraurantiacibacter palmitatis TaxID=2054628 RepID=A0ABV7E734_9SPHN